VDGRSISGFGNTILGKLPDIDGTNTSTIGTNSSNNDISGKVSNLRIRRYNRVASAIEALMSLTAWVCVLGFSNQSFHGARSMYASNIQQSWQNTQQINNVPVPMSVFFAIVNGAYLYGSAMYGPA
jgi:hypothetical protein